MGHNQGGIHGSGLHARLGSQRYTTAIRPAALLKEDRLDVLEVNKWEI
jgi:hypothetical protein